MPVYRAHRKSSSHARLYVSLSSMLSMNLNASGLEAKFAKDDRRIRVKAYVTASTSRCQSSSSTVKQSGGKVAGDNSDGRFE